MRTVLNGSTGMMGAGVAISLGWILFEACDCESSKADRFPSTWVACVGNTPTLMRYFIDGTEQITGDLGRFNAKDWDCSNPNSPKYQKSMTAPYPTSSPSGPLSVKGPRAAATTTTSSFLQRQLRSLPFLPPLPSDTPACDSSFPDVLHPVHINAEVTRISTCPFLVKATIPVVSRPLQIEVTPDGATALVTSFDNAVNFIDLATNTVTFTLMTDVSINPNGIAISPDGARAYVTSFNNSGAVLVIDLVSRKVIATISSIQFAQGATLTPDGSQLWVTSPLAQSMQVIDTLTNTVVTQLAIGQTTGIAFNSTGTRAYVTTAASSPGFVVAVDTATYQRIKSYQVGNGPTDIAMSYGDEYLIVNNEAGKSVTVIDLVQNKVVTTTVSGVPAGIAFVR
jgi:YVTN family beta-propeller protein